ncbi:MAG: cupin domain-containing protein [Methylacidiphilales bacterium]|nr:cupin domain-containing protein [Candidatus Methylacidiphilales bacterium]
MTCNIQVLMQKHTLKSDFDWGSLTWFAGRPLGNSNDMTIGCCILKPGQANPRHYHPNCSEILIVMQGRIEHTGPGAGTVMLSVGDTVTIPANVWHHATNIGETEAILFIAFSSADRQTVGE